MAWFGFGKSRAVGPGQPGPFGSYYLQELLNSGGMADIWLATNANKEACALKRLHHNLRFDPLTKKRFSFGCETLARLQDHEFIIGYIEHGKINGDLFLAMEYVEASNLKQLLARMDPLLSTHIGNILIDMAVGLEHVHDRGFIHLDFKPENVLVTRNANLRLIDFDLAQAKPDKPFKLSRNPGTPAYMAPEQLMRRPIDHRVDIFAFGVTAYEVLTGRKPFPGETPKEVLRRQLEDRSTSFVPVRDLNPDVPFALEKAIVKCVELDPEKRYPHMSVLVRDLEAALYV
jgi:serine/threonine-protein kinase